MSQVKKGEKNEKRNRTNQQLTVCFTTSLLTSFRGSKRMRKEKKISEAGLKPKRLRCEKNNLILKVDLTLWQQQISFSFCASNKRANEDCKQANERERELLLNFRVKFATGLHSSVYMAQLYPNMTNNNYARYKNYVYAMFCGKKAFASNFFMSETKMKENKTKKNFYKLSLWNWVIQK